MSPATHSTHAHGDSPPGEQTTSATVDHPPKSAAHDLRRLAPGAWPISMKKRGNTRASVVRRASACRHATFQFPVQTCKANPYFGANLSSFIAIVAKNTCENGCRLLLYSFNVNMSSVAMLTNPVMRILDRFMVPSQITSFYQDNLQFGLKLCSTATV